MSDAAISRRSALAMLGGAAALAARSSAAAVVPGSAPVPTGPGEGSAPAAASLIAPVAVGARLAGCAVEAIHPIAFGALILSARDADGGAFLLEVCARDASIAAPGETLHHQVFVSNEGDGAMPTTEAHGLAAMALARVVAANEAGCAEPGLLTLRDRLDRHAGSLMRPA